MSINIKMINIIRASCLAAKVTQNNLLDLIKFTTNPVARRVPVRLRWRPLGNKAH